MTNTLAKVTKWLGYLIALLIILAATLVSVGRLLTPYLNDHKSDFEVWASELLATPVKVGQVHISWNVYLPQLTLDNVIILDQQTQKPTFEIEQIKVNLDILNSLIQWEPLPSYIKIAGLNVTLRALGKSGEVDVAGLGHFAITDNLTGASKEANSVAAWIFSQPALVLDDIHIKYISENSDEKFVTLYNLSLYNSQTKHVLKGHATLKQEIPTSVSFGLDWRGDSFNPAKISAKLYLYLEAVSLPQWFRNKTWNNLKINEGLGSAKIWVDWNNGTLQKIQTQFQIYALELHSLLTNKTQTITRLNGNVGWKHDKDKQILAGKDILIDLPQHLWPTTNFYISLPYSKKEPRGENIYPSVASKLDSENSTSSFEVPPLMPSDMILAAPQKDNIGLSSSVLEGVLKTPQSLVDYVFRISYMDFQDIYHFAMMSGLLSEDNQKMLSTIKPKGEIYSLNLELYDLNHLENNLLSAKFHGITSNAWKKFPGIKNLTGTIAWAGKNGSIEINAENAGLSIPSLFANSIHFEKLIAQVKLKNDHNGTWFFHAKNIEAVNEDLHVHTNINITLPRHDSPIVDLSGDFSVSNAKHFSHYVPEKVMDPDLVRWLKQAFIGGQLDSGKVIIKGNMRDFPFANGAGKFVFSTHIKDLEFNYAPQWPSIKRLDGRIEFSGHAMKVEIDQGMLLDFPVSNVSGEIPYIGPSQPQILTIKGIIHGDLAQGLRFINESPLQKTIGQELEGMKLVGPMQLILGLTIPIKRPESSTVSGDVTVSNANLTMLDWGLTLDHLKGMFHFSEQDLEANNLQGNLFGEPIDLDISTEHPAKSPSFVKIKLQSTISASVLESWMKNSSLAQLVSGSPSFQAELNLVSSNQAEPTQVIITSDLKGVSLNLPDGLGKKSEDVMKTEVIANLKQNQPLQIKLKLGTKLTAAATIKKSNQHLELYSGELRIGNTGEASWQTQAGVLISGQFDTLDLKAWEKDFPQMSFASKKNANSVETTQNATGINLLRGVDIRANKIVGLPQKLTRARIQLSKTQNNWNLNINAAEMAGQMVVPKSGSQPIQAKFQYLYLMPLTASKDEPLNPKIVPAINFVANEVRYKGKSFGRVTFNLVPISHGLAINTFRMDSSLYNLNAKGEWLSHSNKNQTRLKGSLTTKNVANFLTHWGSATANPAGSSGTATFDLAWPDAPYSPMLAGMSGDATLQLSPGHIINLDKSTNAKMGFGRMLNILSLESLSRRLTLNFSDLTEKGYSFDSMKGSFNLKNGSAYTEDTRVEGSIARIDLAGRIGLAARDYNLTLSVTPFVTGSIPVVAAIAVNPIIGVAAWAVEKMAGSAFSSATTHRYLITGTWDKPIWKEK